MIFFINGTYNGEIISHKMCAVKVRNAKLRNYLNWFLFLVKNNCSWFSVLYYLFP
jgi:hypothetical protein